MSDEWKGEHLIRKSISKQESKSEVRRLVSSIAHTNRRAKGITHPAAKAHSSFVKLAVFRKEKEE